jgi:hypothetical protein
MLANTKLVTTLKLFRIPRKTGVHVRGYQRIEVVSGEKMCVCQRDRKGR